MAARGSVELPFDGVEIKCAWLRGRIKGLIAEKKLLKLLLGKSD